MGNDTVVVVRDWEVKFVQDDNDEYPVLVEIKKRGQNVAPSKTPDQVKDRAWAKIAKRFGPCPA